MSTSPRIILVATTPRSGSRWLFNAVRMLLGEFRVDVHARWIHDWNRADPAPVHLVKAHKPEHIDFDPDVILSMRRLPEERIASLVRMGWIPYSVPAIVRTWKLHDELQQHWEERSDLVLDYAEVRDVLERSLRRISDMLGISIGDDVFPRIVAAISNLDAPCAGGKYDPVTLLHPGHRRAGHEAGPDAEEILRIARVAGL